MWNGYLVHVNGYMSVGWRYLYATILVVYAEGTIDYRYPGVVNFLTELFLPMYCELKYCQYVQPSLTAWILFTLTVLLFSILMDKYQIIGFTRNTAKYSTKKWIAKCTTFPRNKVDWGNSTLELVKYLYLNYQNK